MAATNSFQKHLLQMAQKDIQVNWRFSMPSGALRSWHSFTLSEFPAEQGQLGSTYHPTVIPSSL